MQLAKELNGYGRINIGGRKLGGKIKQVFFSFFFPDIFLLFLRCF